MDGGSDPEVSSDLFAPEAGAGADEDPRRRFLGMDERSFVIGLTLLALVIVSLAVFITASLLTTEEEVLPSPPPIPNPVAPGFQPLSIVFADAQQGLVSGSVPCVRCASGRGGLIASTDDGGQTWTIRFSTDRPVLGLASIGGTDLVSATATDCRDPAFVDCVLGPLRSDDRGLTWERGSVRNHLWRSPPTAPVPCRHDHPYAVSSSFPKRDLGWVFCGYLATSASYQYKGLYQTRDGGRGTWRELPEFKPRGAGVENPANMPVEGFASGIAFLRGGYGWMWTLNRYSTLSVTENQGMRWSRIWEAPDDESNTTALSASPVSDSVGYLLTWAEEDGSRLLLTRDGGASWAPIQRWPVAPIRFGLP